MEELIAKRYAQALLSVTDKKEKEEFIAIINGIADTLSDKDILTMIDAPIVPDDVKVDAVLSGLGKKADSRLVNLIKLLGEKKRLSLIPALANVLNEQLQKESNSYNGVVRSGKDLSESEVEELEAILDRYTGSKIGLEVEKADSDGLRVSVDDLGIEVNFSKERVKEQLIDFIMKSQ